MAGNGERPTRRSDGVVDEDPTRTSTRAAPDEEPQDAQGSKRRRVVQDPLGALELEEEMISAVEVAVEEMENGTVHVRAIDSDLLMTTL